MLDLSQIEPLSRAPYPYTELQEKCLRDLETTEEPQASCWLMVKEEGSEKFGFCCLGRFCIVAELPKSLGSSGRYYSFGADGATGGLPSDLAKELKLDGLGGFKRGFIGFSSLAGMNDSRQFSFKDIAAYIRHDPWNVFTDEPPAETTQAVASEVAA